MSRNNAHPLTTDVPKENPLHQYSAPKTLRTLRQGNIPLSPPLHLSTINLSKRSVPSHAAICCGSLPNLPCMACVTEPRSQSCPLAPEESKIRIFWLLHWKGKLQYGKSPKGWVTTNTCSKIGRSLTIWCIQSSITVWKQKQNQKSIGSDYQCHADLPKHDLITILC